MKIEVDNPKFLLAVLKDEFIKRTTYLVENKNAYGDDWRDDFVELIQVMRQLEEPRGDKLNEAIKQTVAEQVFPDFKVKTEPLFTTSMLVKNTWPVGMNVMVGKGKTVWTVTGYREEDVHLGRDGKGRNDMVVSATKLKKFK